MPEKMGIYLDKNMSYQIHILLIHEEVFKHTSDRKKQNICNVFSSNLSLLVTDKGRLSWLFLLYAIMFKRIPLEIFPNDIQAV